MVCNDFLTAALFGVSKSEKKAIRKEIAQQSSIDKPEIHLAGAIQSSEVLLELSAHFELVEPEFSSKRLSEFSSGSVDFIVDRTGCMILRGGFSTIELRKKLLTAAVEFDSLRILYIGKCSYCVQARLYGELLALHEIFGVQVKLVISECLISAINDCFKKS